MSDVNEVAELLGPLSARFGVKFISLAKKRWDVAHERFPSRFSGCPFAPVYVDFEGRRIYFREGQQQGCTLIHELGHAIFGIDEGHRGMEEYQWHGWEHRVAASLGLEEQWILEQGSYEVRIPGSSDHFGSTTAFAYLTAEQRVLYLKEAKQDSKRTGSYFVGFEKGEKGLWPLLD